MHLSILTQYFIPFGNFIFPVIIWGSTKDRSNYIDNHGRSAINFQLSILVYSIVLALIAIPILLFTILKNIPIEAMITDNDFLIRNFTIADLSGIASIALIAAFLFFLIKLAEFFLVIYASVKASNGERFSYPATIRFIPSESQKSDADPPAPTSSNI